MPCLLRAAQTLMGSSLAHADLHKVSRCCTRDEGIRCAQARKHAREGSTLALKSRAHVTRRPKRGYQWLHEKDSLTFLFRYSSHYPTLKSCLSAHTGGCSLQERSIFEGLTNLYEYVCNEGKEGNLGSVSLFSFSKISPKSANYDKPNKQLFAYNFREKIMKNPTADDFISKRCL